MVAASRLPRPTESCERREGRTVLISVFVHHHPYRPKNDREVAADIPIRDIFKISLQTVGQIGLLFGRAAEAADLGQAGHPGLDGVPVPVSLVDCPEGGVLGGRAERAEQPCYPDHQVDGQLRVESDLPASTDRFRAPVFSARRSKVLFYKNGLPYYAARSVVDALLFRSLPYADADRLVLVAEWPRLQRRVTFVVGDLDRVPLRQQRVFRE